MKKNFLLTYSILIAIGVFGIISFAEAQFSNNFWRPIGTTLVPTATSSFNSIGSPGGPLSCSGSNALNSSATGTIICGATSGGGGSGGGVTTSSALTAGQWVIATGAGSIYSTSSQPILLITSNTTTIGVGTVSPTGTVIISFTNPGYITTSTNNFGGITGITFGGVTSSTFNVGLKLTMSASGTLGLATTSISQWANDASFVTTVTQLYFATSSVAGTWTAAQTFNTTSTFNATAKFASSTASKCARFDVNQNLVSATGDCSAGDTSNPSTTIPTNTNQLINGNGFISNNATGSTGQVGVFNGVNTLTGYSGLFWDSTNNFLGVGTSQPSSTFHVIGDTYLSGNLLFLMTTTSTPRTMGTFTQSGISGTDITGASFNIVSAAGIGGGSGVPGGAINISAGPGGAGDTGADGAKIVISGGVGSPGTGMGATGTIYIAPQGGAVVIGYPSSTGFSSVGIGSVIPTVFFAVNGTVSSSQAYINSSTIKTLFDSQGNKYSTSTGGIGTVTTSTAFTSGTIPMSNGISAILDSVITQLNGIININNGKFVVGPSNNSTTNPITVPAGTVTNNSIQIAGSPGTGIFSSVAQTFNISTNAVSRVAVSSTGATFTVPVLAPAGTLAAPSIAFSADPGTGLQSSSSISLNINQNGITRINVATSTGIGTVASTSVSLQANGAVWFNTSTPNAFAATDATGQYGLFVDNSAPTSSLLFDVQSSSSVSLFNVASSGIPSYIGTSTALLGGSLLAAVGNCTNIVTTVPILLSSSTDGVDIYPQNHAGVGLYDYNAVISAVGATSTNITSSVCAIVIGTPAATKANIFFKRITGL